MKANIEVICYKYKPLKDGTLPLMLRVTKDRKRKYVSLGLSLHEKFWDFEKSKPKRNCPNKEQIERLIAAKTAEYNDLIVEMTSQQREYTVETLVSHFHNQVRCATVVELYDKLIDDMKRGGKLGNAGVYKYSRTSLLKFTGQRLQIPFSETGHCERGRAQGYCTRFVARLSLRTISTGYFRVQLFRSRD